MSLINLIDNFDHNASDTILKKYYYGGSDICKQILSLGDYYLASKGHLDNGFEKDSEKCLRWANQNYELIKKQPQYQTAKMMTLSQFSEISLKNSNHLFKNLLQAYLDGKFNITQAEWKSLVSSQNKGGLFLNI
jgi:hypothetical protein